MRNVRREIQDFERFEQIIRILASNGFKDIVTRLDLQHYLPITDKYINPEPTPQRFRETVEELGTVFIKFGQMLAERKDLIPERYAEELKKLENEVPPFDPVRAKQIVDEDVGLENFEDFSKDPIASASIAQVHTAKLENGEKVAVKVRRPGLIDQVRKDLDIIRFFANEFDKHQKSEHGQFRRDIEEFTRWTMKEVNLKNEAKNAERLRKNLADEDRIRIPKIYGELTTPRVLVTEYIEAFRVDEREKIEDIDISFEEIARLGVRSQLKQILRDGFFHADPHPSNFLVDKNGNLVYLDFGIMGKFTPKKRRLLTLMFYYTLSQDVEGLMSVLEELGYEEKDYDPDELKHEVERIVLELQGTTLNDNSFTKSFAKLSLAAGRHGLYMPNDLIVMGKGMATMEGIGIDVYPEYSFQEQNFQDIKEIMKKQFDPKDSMKELGVDFLRNRDKLTKLTSNIIKSQDGSGQTINITNSRNNSNMLPAALIVGSTLLFYKTLPDEYMLPVALVELLAAVHLLE